MANGNMSPIGFAILFGGETTDNRVKFWEDAVSKHPSINRPIIAIIMDQNPGCIAALAKIVPESFHFYCSWHRCQNKITGTTLWMFNCCQVVGP